MIDYIKDLASRFSEGTADESAYPANAEEPADLLFAKDSQGTYDNFNYYEGRAAIYEEIFADKPLNIDLFIRNVDFRLEEHIQVSPHVGDTFGITCFGKAPLIATFSGILADTQITFGKQYLVDAWKNRLRLTAVARRGKIPVIKYENMAYQGPFLKMRITEDSKSEDSIIVVLEMLVTQMQAVGDGTPVFFDYVHGVESDDTSDFITSPLGVEEKNKPDEEQKAEENIKEPEVSEKPVQQEEKSTEPKASEPDKPKAVSEPEKPKSAPEPVKTNPPATDPNAPGPIDPNLFLPGASATPPYLNPTSGNTLPGIPGTQVEIPDSQG